MLDLRAPRGGARIIGHRGAMGQAPENTLVSFQTALEQGAEGIELDVHLSLDGEVVVIHDESLGRTAGESGLVRDRTLAELRQLDPGQWFDPRFTATRIPTLTEVLELVNGRVPVLIEIKQAPIPYAGIEAKVLQVIQDAGALESVQVISFDHPTLLRLRQLSSAIATGVLYACRPLDAVALARAVDAQALAPHWSYVQSQDVRAAHHAGLSVQAWATSDVNVVRRLLSYGVDAITTNDPAIVLDALGRSAAPEESVASPEQ
jgi:glycerophosphoryl diester phosphodiesterase